MTLYEGKFYRSSWSCYYYYYWSILETKAWDCYTCSFGSSCLSSLSNCGLRGEESSAFSRSPWYQNSSATSPAIWNNNVLLMCLNWIFVNFLQETPRKVLISTMELHALHFRFLSLLRTFREYYLVSKCFLPAVGIPMALHSPPGRWQSSERR